MDDRIAELEQKVQTLTEQMNDLKDLVRDLDERAMTRISDLRYRVFMLTFGKVADPRAPYFNWMLEADHGEALSNLLNALFRVVSQRIAGEEVDPVLRDRIAPVLQERMKDKQAARELLFGMGAVVAADVIEAIQVTILIQEHREVRDLMKTVEKQMHHYQALCDLVMGVTGR